MTGTVEQWKCRFDDPNVAFHSERLHLWTEDRVYGFMQSDGCAVVVDVPRYPEPVEREWNMGACLGESTPPWFSGNGRLRSRARKA